MIVESDLLTVFGSGQFQTANLAIHVCERNWTWVPRPFSDFDFWLVLSGSGSLGLNRARYVLEAGMGFLFQPGDRVEGSKLQNDPLVVFACHVFPVRVPAANGRVSAENLTFRTRHIEFFRMQAEEALRCDSIRDDALAGGFVKLLVAGMIIRGFLSSRECSTGGAPQILYDLASEIRSDPGRDWQLSFMAKRCFLSVPHFTRVFRRIFAMSPRQFVIAHRIRRAVYLLQESSMSIQEIASSLGYTDHYFFHRQFKAIVGATPLAVRKGADVQSVGRSL
jgi:AraC-like DNA-binding protein